jgi:hypothetical protein
MNKRNIVPVEFWTPEGNKSAGEILLYNFHGYNFDGTDSIVSYKLGNTTVVGEGEEAQEQWKSLSEGSVRIPDDVVQAWGEDDEPIFDYVIEQLGLTEI